MLSNSQAAHHPIAIPTSNIHICNFDMSPKPSSGSKSSSPSSRKGSGDSASSRGRNRPQELQFVSYGQETRQSLEPTFVQYTGPPNERGVSPTAPTFQFVNTSSTSRTVGLAERTLARSHVAKTASRGPQGEMYRQRLTRTVSPGRSSPLPSPTPTFARFAADSQSPPARKPSIPITEQLQPVVNFCESRSKPRTMVKLTESQ